MKQEVLLMPKNTMSKNTMSKRSISKQSKLDHRKPKQVRQKALLARLSRVEGQIRAVRRMVDEDQPCEMVAQQLAAARTAINKAFCEMMACAIEHGITEELALDAKAQDKIGKLADVLTRYG